MLFFHGPVIPTEKKMDFRHTWDWFETWLCFHLGACPLTASPSLVSASSSPTWEERTRWSGRSGDSRSPQQTAPQDVLVAARHTRGHVCTPPPCPPGPCGSDATLDCSRMTALTGVKGGTQCTRLFFVCLFIYILILALCAVKFTCLPLLYAWS